MTVSYEPYWIETITKLWSKLSFAGEGTYSVYIKKTGTESPSIDNVMIFGDDFTGDLSKWSGSGTISGGQLSLTSQEVLSLNTYSNAIVEFGLYSVSADDAGAFGLASASWAGGTQRRFDLGYPNAGLVGVYEGSYINTGYSNSTPDTYRILQESTSSTKYSQGTTQIYSTPSNSNGLKLAMRAGTGKTLIFDWVRVRKYLATPPTVSAPTVIDANTLKFTITTTEAVTDYQFEFDVTLLSLSSTTESIHVSLDETAPTITYESGQLYTSNTEIVQYAEIVDESNLSSVTIQRNSDTPISMTKVSGSLNVYGATVPIYTDYNYLQITATDEWGNSSTSATKTVIGIGPADDRPVVTLVGTYPSTTTEDSIEVTVTAVGDEINYVKLINSKIAGSVEMTATGNLNEYSGITNLKYGDNLLRVEVMGPTGWYGFSTTIVITKTDSSGPTIYFDTTELTIRDNFLDLYAGIVDEGSGISSVNAAYDGTSIPMSLIGAGTYYCRLENLAKSIYSIKIRAIDNDTNISESSAKTVNLLTVPLPKITMVSNEIFLTETGLLQFNINFPTGITLADSELLVNGESYSLGLVLGLYQTTAPLEIGENSVEITIQDSNGNYVTESYTVTRVSIQDTDITDALLSHFTHNFDKEETSNLYKLNKAYADELNELLQVIEQVNLYRDIDYAEGFALDRIGIEIGQYRGGATDSQYRVMIKLKMSRYLSSGTYDEVIMILANAFNTSYENITITPFPDDEMACVEISIEPVILANAGFSRSQALALMQSVVASGVRVAALLEGTFTFGSFEGEIDATKGFGDELGTTGGTLSGYITDDTDLPL